MWSLQDEICRLTNATNFVQSLRELHLIGPLETDFFIREDPEWAQGGAETYVYRFWIKHYNGTECGYIMKACIAFSPGSSVVDIVREWVTRRLLIKQKGIRVPELVAYGGGLLIEELIPYRLQDVLHRSPKPLSALYDLAKWAGVLTTLGFAPIEAFSDLRSHGNDVVVVDFGEDLGPPRAKAVSSERYFTALLVKLKQWKIHIDDQLHAELHRVFQEAQQSSGLN